MELITVETIKGRVVEPVYNIDDYPYEDIRMDINDKRCFGRGKKASYYNVSSAFDIECSTIEPPKNADGKYITTPNGFMYHWQFCIDNKVCFGRTWEQWVLFKERLVKALHLDKKMKLAVYVHNLAYEFQFMKEFMSIESLFAKEERKPLKVNETNGLEYRCSYFLSNMSLKKFCENSSLCTYYKMDGEDFDYRAIRTPATELTEKQKGYCYNDVRGLCQCIDTMLLEDTISTIPLTNTGFVRRDFRSAMNTMALHKLFKKLALNSKEYTMLRKAFRGGNTHANRYYTNQIINNVKSKDISSSYPTVMLECSFPMERFTEYEIDDIGEFYEMIEKYHCCFTVGILNPRIKKNVAVPYIDLAHCEERCNTVNDNGRVLRACKIDDKGNIIEDGYVKITVTEVDWEIIEETYDYDDIEITEFMYARGGKLPLEFRNMVMKYYHGKTKLKGISEKEYEYMKSKNKLNSSFGMCVTDICHNEVDYIDFESGWSTSIPEIDGALKEFYSSRNNFLSYQWGVWVTAHARRRLQDMLNKVGLDLVYCDTDSIKYVNHEKHDKEFEEKNVELLSLALNNDIPATSERDGKQYPLGIWDEDGTYLRFKTLGAKKYCYEKVEKNKSHIKADFNIISFHITVSGMGKKKGAERVSHIGRFEIGKTFEDIGRTTSWFNDSKPHEITVDGCTFTTASNIGVLETTYTLGVTMEYWELFNGLNPADLQDAI